MSRAAAGPELTGHPDADDIEAKATHSRSGLLTLMLMIAIYIAVYVTICLIKWRFFLYSDFDVAIDGQGCWMAMHGSLNNSILGLNYLGNHVAPIIFLLAPIYALFNSPVVLLALQTAVLGLGALPVYWLARSELKNEFIALCMGAVYLLYPALGYSNLYEFHPATLATTTLLFAFYFLWTRRLWWMTLFVALSLLCKEDVPLPVAMMGLYALLLKRPGRWRYSVVLLGLAAASLVVSFAIIQPATNKNEMNFEKIYSPWGASTGQALVGMAEHPVRVGESLMSTPGDARDTATKHEYYVQMLMPVMFLSALSPATLIIALPSVGQHLLSTRITEHAIAHHYAAYVTPFVILGAVLGLRNLLRFVCRHEADGVSVEVMNKRTRARTVGTLVAAVAVTVSVGSNLWFGPVMGVGVLRTFSPPEENWPTPYRCSQAGYMREFLSRIPAQAPVVASFTFLPHVCNRTAVYSLHHIYSGRYTLSDRDYPIPSGVEALVADVNDYFNYTPADGGARLRALVQSNGLVPVDCAGTAVLFLREPGEAIHLWETGDFVPEVARAMSFNRQLDFMGFDSVQAKAAVGGRIAIRTLWKRMGAVDHIYYAQFVLLDGDGNIVASDFHRLGYTFYPVQDWPSGAVVREFYNFIVPAGTAPGRYVVGLRVACEAGKGMRVLFPDQPKAVDENALIPLGKLQVVSGSASSGLP